ncbi:uncharacterized protein [Apostichopus japonicus]|uniref:uncharacterized protein n=1 Tax=Stichopus japonicus TaxID=307972 RepID=UPI003AB1BD3C
MPPKKKIKRKRLVFTRKHINKDLSVTRIPVKFFPVNIPHVSTENVCDRTAPSTSRTPSMDHVAAEVRIEKSPSAAETEPTKKEEEVRAWQNIRRNVQTAYIESSVPSCTCCQVCSQPSPEVLVICFDCDTRPVMCPGCAVEKHALNTKFHNLVQYKDGVRSTFNFKKELKATHHEDCGNVFMRSMDVFDHRGRGHTCDFIFCSCVPEVESLVRCGYWPSSAKGPRCAIRIELLEWMRVLLLETQSSLRAICHSLQWKNYMSDSETAYLYRTLTHETFEEFRFFHYKTERLPEEEEGLYDDGSACPACPKKNDSIFVSLDANFGLVRKKKSGTSLEPPKHASKFFINQEEVDDYVDQYSTQTSSKEEHQECNSFQATSVIRTKNKTANLDATGVFGSACRHGVPRLFLSMRHGERYAYPALLLKKLLTRSTLHHHVIYDIACKFDTHIKKNLPQLTGYDLALPVFHAYGHKVQCQVAYSTRWRKDYGLTDGEGMEKLWSYLRKFAHITKEMTPSHRIDLLSDALRHFAMGKVCNQAASLCLCLQKCRDVAQKSNSEIQEICREYGQAIAQRVGKQIKKSSASIKGLIQTYNGIFRLDQPITLHKWLTCPIICIIIWMMHIQRTNKKFQWV